MKALTKPEKFQAMSRIYGYELPDDVIGYHCVDSGDYIEIKDEFGVVIDAETIWVCESVVDETFDCEECDG